MLRSSFNQGWTVRTEGPTAVQRIVGPVTVPYDAMLFEQRDPSTPNGHHTGFFPGGVYRYSKTFAAPAEWRERTVSLEFEGVYMNSEVFVNGVRAGGQPSGYSLFHVTLDDRLNYDAENTVEVVARNDQIPNSRWYTGSGIYRPVNLLIGGRVRVTPGGARFSTRSIDGVDALVDVAVEIINDTPEQRRITLTASIAAPDGARLAAVIHQASLAAGETTVVREQIAISRAETWSPDTPRLHSATVTVSDGETVLDETLETFGIRTIEVDAQRGLQINGQTVKLRGSCIHHDNGVIGAHTLDAAEDRRIRLLKSSGYNAIRSAHNPASRATLHACDRHGVLVMDELTDAWRRPKVTFDYSNDFEQWWERDLTAMIAKDFNHPSVVMYSIGNEIAETATEWGVATNRRLADRTRELDPSRLVTNCINGFLNLLSPTNDAKQAEKRASQKAKGEAPNKNLIVILNYLMAILERTLKYIVRLPRVDRRTRDAYAALDVAGYNYMVGRYRTDAKKHPTRIIVGSETNGAQTVKNWPDVAELPQVIGDFTWTGWDYIGEAGYMAVRYNERRKLFSPWPGLLAGMPVIDITGHRQTQSYLNEIVWGLRRGPHLAVQPVNHASEKRSGAIGRTDSIHSWSWEGFEGRSAIVEVYADAHRVELLLDGVRVGRKQAGRKKDFLAKFSLPYRPGELTAVAYDRHGHEVGRDTLTSAGPGLQLMVEPETQQLSADGADLAYIPISFTDHSGTLRPLADRIITIEVTGAAVLLGFGSAQPLCDEGFSTMQHSSYYGRALAVIRAGHVPGDVVITVSAQGCEPATATLAVVENRAH